MRINRDEHTDDHSMALLETGEQEAPAPVTRRRPRLPEWEIKSDADLGRVYSQAVEVETPDGARVLRWEGAEYEQEADAEPERNLEPDPYWEKLGERGAGAQALFDAGLSKKAVSLRRLRKASGENRMLGSSG